jgi:KaiC/GvpD/RAD55 family RecA-like ATPase
VHEKTNTALRGDDGKPLYYERLSSGTSAPGLKLDSGALAAGLDAIKRQREADDRERERIRIEAERKRATRKPTDNTEIIGAFNDSVSIETLLESYGYQRSPRHPEDWRSPHQQGETYATRIIGAKWVSLSGSDAAANLGDKCAAGCYGDAYDLFVHFEHGGEHKAAFKQLHAERKAGQPMADRRPEPPPPEMDDYGAMPPEPEGLEAADALEPGTMSPENQFPLVWYSDIQPVLVNNWVVKNVIPAEAFVTIIGHPGCGKSFMALDMALHVATGREWQGRKVKPGLVVYLAAEGQRGQLNRVEAWRRKHGIEDMPFAIIPVAVNLRDREADIPKLIATIEAACFKAGLPLAVLIVDTLNRTFGGGDENGEDMGEYVDNSQRIRAHFACTTITVHHVPKNSENPSERGHGSLRGAIDTSLLVSSDLDSGIRTLRCVKQKDGEDGWQSQFKLTVIELGIDEDGDAVTSCVVEPAEDDMAAARSFTGPRLSGTQRQIYQELLATVEACGVPVPRDVPEDQVDRYKVGKVASVKEWRERWIAVAGSDLNQDSATATFRRAKTDLQNKKLIGVWNDHAWATFQ